VELILRPRGMKLFYERSILDALSEFDPSKLTKWYVVDRKHGKE
jgi:hypothetical protein